MADYRAISQEYAFGAIKAAILVNGGASIAVLSQFSSLEEEMEVHLIAAALLCYVFGTSFGVLTWLVGFLSTRHVDRTLRGEDSGYKLANRYMFVGYFFLSFSLLLFIFAAFLLAYGLVYSGQP